MKVSPLIKLLLAMSLSNLQGEDMQKYLQDTVIITKKGKYKEALERHVWFHDNALEHAPSMTGVRLSFALSYWTDLGAKYPPALEKLNEIRNQKEQVLRLGKGGFDLFHDVTSINRVLNEDERSIKLFKEIEKETPERIEQLWIVVKDIAFQQKDHKLLNRHIKDTEQEYRNIYSDYLRDFKMFKEQDELKWIKDRFRKVIDLLIELSKFNGDEAMANKIEERASKVLLSENGIVE